MRNHGFLWDGAGWRLSPAFDVNPTPGEGVKYLSNTIDLEDASATAENALRAAEYYRMDEGTAKEELRRMRQVVAGWARVARSQGISEASAQRMGGAFRA